MMSLLLHPSLVVIILQINITQFLYVFNQICIYFGDLKTIQMNALSFIIIR